MAQAPHEVIREAVDELIQMQARHLHEKGMTIAQRLYGDTGKPKPMELVLGKMEAEAIIECFMSGASRHEKDQVKLSVMTYLGYPVIVEGETGVKVRPATAKPSTQFVRLGDRFDVCVPETDDMDWREG